MGGGGDSFVYYLEKGEDTFRYLRLHNTKNEHKEHTRLFFVFPFNLADLEGLIGLLSPHYRQPIYC